MKKYFKLASLLKVAKIILIFIVLPALTLTSGYWWGKYDIVKWGKTSYDNVTWYNESDGGINDGAMVKIGGYDQFVRIRGRNLDNPVFIELHGGPGGAGSGFTHRMLRPLTEYFTVVEWDQRGVGRSSWDDAIIPTMTYEQMVDDTIEVIDWALKKTGKSKVIVAGHSWGSMLGVGVVKKRPDLVHVYLGVGQMVAWNRNFEESRRLLMEKAKKVGADMTYDMLSSVPDNYPTTRDNSDVSNYIAGVQRHLFGLKNGFSYALKDGNIFPAEMVLDTVFSPDNSVKEVVEMFMVGAGEFSPPVMELIHDLSKVDYLKDEAYQSLDVPVIIFQGKHDYQTPKTLAEEWFDKVKAPHKQYFEFEHSAHVIFTDEFAKYNYLLVDVVRPFAMANGDE